MRGGIVLWPKFPFRLPELPREILVIDSHENFILIVICVQDDIDHVDGIIDGGLDFLPLFAQESVVAYLRSASYWRPQVNSPNGKIGGISETWKGKDWLDNYKCQHAADSRNERQQHYA